MLRKLFETNGDISSLVLRVMLGVVFFPHGFQKLLGWFGGDGYPATMAVFTQKMGIPAFLAFLAIMAESLGSLGLLTGFLTRISALGIATNMVVAIFMVHIHNGFFMNWFGNKTGEGFEYHLLAIAIALALIIRGGGRWSVDKLLAKKL
ncbi:MAG: DoxX family protein [Nitrospirae bacterium]|nr:DoxX family protein [Nitrospirota bacterium]